MAAENTIGKIVLHRPESGQTSQVAMLPGQTYMLDFDLDATTFDRQDADMRLNFDDGAILDLGGFFSAPDTGDFTLQLRDGTLLSGRDVVEALTLAIQDFHTDESVASFVSGPQAADDDAARPLPGNESEPLPHSHPHPLSPTDTAGLLCHESCNLFDEDLSLPGRPDPLFDAPTAPLSRPAAQQGNAPLLNQSRPDDPLHFAELLDDGETLADRAPAPLTAPPAAPDHAAAPHIPPAPATHAAPPTGPAPDHASVPGHAAAPDHASVPGQNSHSGADQFFLDFLPFT